MEIYLAHDVKSALQEVIVGIVERKSQLSDATISFNDRGLTTHTRLQVFYNFKHATKLHKLLYDIIIEHAIMSERMGPGSFDLCLEMISKRFLGGEVANLEDEKEHLKTVLAAGAIHPTCSDIAWLISKYAGAISPRVQQMLQEALELSGFGGRIIVEKTKTEPGLELVQGYTFGFGPAFSVTKKLLKPRVACIDGFIEEVSEVHHMLEAASAAKEPVLLFVRGLSDDVLHTLKVNCDRGTLLVIPIVVRFDFDGINTLADICAISGGDMVSSHKGDLISSIDFAELPKVDSAFVFPNRIVISNASTSDRVNAHVQHLRRKRMKENEDSVAKLFDERIKTLSPNHVMLRLLNDKDYVKNSQAIDYVLRAYSSMLRYGIVEIDNHRELMATYAASSLYTAKCLAALKQVGAVLT